MKLTAVLDLNRTDDYGNHLLALILDDIKEPVITHTKDKQTVIDQLFKDIDGKITWYDNGDKRGLHGSVKRYRKEV